MSKGNFYFNLISVILIKKLSALKKRVSSQSYQILQTTKMSLISNTVDEQSFLTKCVMTRKIFWNANFSSTLIDVVHVKILL